MKDADLDVSKIPELCDLNFKTGTKLSQRVQELLSDFVTLHEYFLSKSVEKVKA